MHELGKYTDKIIFALAYPMLYFLMRGTTRTRVAVMNGDNILLLRSRLNFGSYVLPGGGVKKGETDADSARREIHEEIGLNIEHSQLEYLGEKRLKPHGIPTKLVLYKTQIKDRHSIRLSRIEIVEAVWIPIGRLDEIPMPKDEKHWIGQLVTPYQR